MRLKIISDGLPRNTHIVNAATGERLEGVQDITWLTRKNTQNVVQVTINVFEIEAKGCMNGVEINPAFTDGPAQHPE